MKLRCLHYILLFWFVLTILTSAIFWYNFDIQPQSIFELVIFLFNSGLLGLLELIIIFLIVILPGVDS